MKIKLCILIFALSAFLCSCQAKETVVQTDRIQTVEVKKLESEKVSEYLSYVGIVNSDSLKKYSLKSSGKITAIHVEKGQIVKQGDVLLEIDRSDLQFQVNAAKQQSDAAYAQYSKALSGAQDEDIKSAAINVKKAQDASDFAHKSCDDIKKLYAQGAVSKSNLEQAELNVKLSDNELSQAKEMLKKAEAGSRNEDINAAKSQYEAAKTNYDAMLKLYNESILTSDVNGYVTDILYEKGELLPQGYPAVIVESKDKVVSVGIIQDDMDKISIGSDAKVTISDSVYSGKIINISQTPDEESHTYNVEISIANPDKKLYLGSIAKAEIAIGSADGIWLDINNILNDGKNYVYLAKGDTACRVDINISKIINDKVLVTDLKNEDVLIVNGMKQIKDGSKIETIND